MTIAELKDLLGGFEPELEIAVENPVRQGLLAIIEVLYVEQRNRMVIFTGGLVDD